MATVRRLAAPARRAPLLVALVLLLGPLLLPTRPAAAVESCATLDAQAAGLQPGTSGFDDLTDRRLASGCAAYQAGPDPSNPSAVLYLRGLRDSSVVSVGRILVSSIDDIALTDLGQLYGVRTSDFYRIDRRTGASTYVGATGYTVNALVVAPDGTLYGAGGNRLVRIDPATGQATLIGALGGNLESSGDLAFASGNLYVTVHGPASDQLARVNTTTGAASVIGDIGFPDVFGLVAAGGELFGATSGGALLSISATTGAGSTLGPIGPRATGLAGAPSGSGPTTCPDQYRTEYFNNKTLAGSAALIRCESWPIDHDWGTGNPGPGIAVDNFSARWTGQARFDAGTYTFTATADDGIRVWLDGLVVFDEWRDQAAATFAVTRTVAAGSHDIKVEYYEGNGNALARFRWDPVAGPANDHFANATEIGGDAAGLTGTNTGATKETGEPNHAGSPGGHSVWYRFPAFAGGTVTFSTAGSDFDTLLAVYTGPAVNALTQIVANDDIDGGSQSRVGPFAMAAGIPHYIAVDGFGGQTGTVRLSWQFQQPTAPAAPTGLQAYGISTSTARLQWLDNASDESYFEVTNGSETRTAPASSESLTGFDWTGLAPATYMCFAVRAVNVAGTSAWTPYSCMTTSSATTGGRYTPLTPARILDTRDGTGGISGAVGAGATVDVQITGRGGIPASGVTAVAMNVTVTQPAATGYLTLYPSGNTRPLAANHNFDPGKTVPNLVVVKVGAGGKVALFNSSGTSHVIFDVAGWYSDDPMGNAGRYVPLVPARILDTRDGTGGGVRLGPGASLDLQVSGRGGVPAWAGAAVLNVAVTGTTSVSFLTVHPTGQVRPLAANLNFAAGDTVSNRVMAKLGTGGKVTIYNNSGSTDVVVDVGGWYTDATVTGSTGIFRPLVPARILDTRDGTGGSPGLRPAGSTIDVQVTGRGAVPASGVTAVILNVTVTQPGPGGYLTMFPSGAAQPLASDLNYANGETRPNLVVVGVGSGGRVSLFTSAGTHVVIDVAGWFD